MSEAPQTRRRWLLFAVRTLFVVMTLIVAMIVMAIELSDFQHKVDIDSVDHVPDAVKSIRPWMIGLKRFSSYVLLGAVLCGTYAVFRAQDKNAIACCWYLSWAFSCSWEASPVT